MFVKSLSVFEKPIKILNVIEMNNDGRKVKMRNYQTELKVTKQICQNRFVMKPNVGQ